MIYSLEKLPSYEFFYERWNAGSLHSLGLLARYYDVISFRGKRIIKEHAIGWSDGENVPCRPKEGTIAVLFYKDGTYFWTHLMINEFNEIFLQESI